MVTLNEIAKAVDLEVDLVRDVLNEKHGLKIAKSEADRVFNTARKLGYDFRKLRLGKRMHWRKEAFEEVLARIEGEPGWSREKILQYLRQNCEMIERVQRRTFQEEFGGEG